MGGFHVSGCLSMLDGRAVDLDACRAMGISMFAGEAEGRLDVVLRDAAAGRLAAVYNFMKELPPMQGTPVPFLPRQYVARTLGLSTSFDAGRGCPYQCSFCTIINVQGRTSRYRSADGPQLRCCHARGRSLSRSRWDGITKGCNPKGTNCEIPHAVRRMATLAILPGVSSSHFSATTCGPSGETAV